TIYAGALLLVCAVWRGGDLRPSGRTRNAFRTTASCDRTQSTGPRVHYRPGSQSRRLRAARDLVCADGTRDWIFDPARADSRGDCAPGQFCAAVCARALLRHRLGGQGATAPCRNCTTRVRTADLAALGCSSSAV